MEDGVKTDLAQQLKERRLARGWTLEQLADQSGVSRAMISKIERGEASPTAVVLARLAAGFGVTLASLFSSARTAAAPLLRWEDQQSWQDPASGYVRRNVSPAGTAAEIVYVNFPAGARVVFDNAAAANQIEQQVWILEGQMHITAGAVSAELGTGDSFVMGLDAPITFHNPGEVEARYVVVLARKML